MFNLVKGLLLKLFPSLGPKGVVNTQIAIYKKLKRKYPTASEDDILNSLIMSRIKSPLSPTTSQKEIDHYGMIFKNTNKTLEDVIWTIVEYEYILSRFGNYQNLKEDLSVKLSKINYTPEKVQEDINKEKDDWRQYIKEKVQDIN